MPFPLKPLSLRDKNRKIQNLPAAVSTPSAFLPTISFVCSSTHLLTSPARLPGSLIFVCRHRRNCFDKLPQPCNSPLLKSLEPMFASLCNYQDPSSTLHQLKIMAAGQCWVPQVLLQRPMEPGSQFQSPGSAALQFPSPGSSSTGSEGSHTPCTTMAGRSVTRRTQPFLYPDLFPRSSLIRVGLSGWHFSLAYLCLALAFLMTSLQVSCAFTSTGTVLTITLPPSAIITPPGVYTIFAVTNGGRPSTGM